MKFTLLTLTFLSTLMGQADAQVTTWACGPAGPITAAGSTTVAPVTNLSGITYTKTCKNNTVTVSLGGSSNGARRGCADPAATGGLGPVDIGNMSRDWRTTEASSTDGINYKCLIGNTSRVLIKQAVAIDGISIVVERNGILDACLKTLGYSLTSAQLRWAFSNRTDLDVKPTIANADGNPATRKWSELNAACPDFEILGAAPSPLYGTNEFFREVIFTAGASEGFRSGVIATFQDNSAALRDYVLNTDYSIGFFGYAFYSQFDGPLLALGVDGIQPNRTTLTADTYVPLGRRIFSNYLTDTIAVTKCFNDFHYTAAGELVVITTEFLPIPSTEWTTLKNQVPGTCVQPGAPTPSPKPCKCFFLFKILGLCCRKK